MFANGGFRITPWFIDEVKDRDGKVIFKEKPPTACRGCGRGGVAGKSAAQSNVVDGFDLSPAEATVAPRKDDPAKAGDEPPRPKSPATRRPTPWSRRARSTSASPTS